MESNLNYSNYFLSKLELHLNNCQVSLFLRFKEHQNLWIYSHVSRSDSKSLTRICPSHAFTTLSNILCHIILSTLNCNYKLELLLPSHVEILAFSCIHLGAYYYSSLRYSFWVMCGYVNLRPENTVLWPVWKGYILVWF